MARKKSKKPNKAKAGPAVAAAESQGSGRGVPWDLLVCVFLIAITLMVYWQARRFDFVNYDDNLYITDNAHTQAGLTWENVRWAFTTGHASNWHPLTWLSYMLDVELFGQNPAAHHLINVLFHMANAVLLFLVVRRMTGALWQSAFVAALFAVHPLHVESVAWIAERKDVLSTLFWLLAMAAYLSYVRRPGVVRYLAVMAALAVGLMVKPMLVTLPAVLLLLDCWPLDRFDLKHSDRSAFARRIAVLVAEKVPLVALATLSSAITMLAQRSGKAVAAWDVLPFSERAGNALVSYVRYIWMTVWPARLAAFYPHPGPNLPVWQVAGAVAVLTCLTVLAILTMRRRPYLIVGWLWYLGTLLPVIGIVQVGAQALADRYTYVPLIGIFIMVAWGVAALAAGLRAPRAAVAGAAVLALAALTVCAGIQTSHWRNSITLFEHALRVTSRNYLAHKNLGVALANAEEYAKAAPHYLKAIEYKPNDADLYYNLGNALDKLGKPKEAIERFRKALEVDPSHVETLYNLGNTLARQGRYAEAEAAYADALRINPDHLGVIVNMGNTLAMQERPVEAAKLYRKAIRLDPDEVDPYINLANALAAQEKFDEAVSNYEKAIHIEPRHVEAHCNLGHAFVQQGKLEEAAKQFSQVLRIDPGNARAREHLKNLEAAMDRRNKSGGQVQLNANGSTN